MRIIHISDLHLPAKDTTTDQEKVISALCRDIKIVNEKSSVDVVVFSGDIAAKGQTSPSFINAACEKVFDPIKAILKPGVPIVLCPGNHDVNLKDRDDLYSPIFSAISSPSIANSTFEKISKNSKGFLDHMAGYISLAKKVNPQSYSTNPFFYTEKLEVAGLSVGIASLNSAWLTKGGGHSDYGSLFLAERQIDSALAEISECTIKIAVMHHTLKWLHPSEGGLVQRLLSSNFHAILCGHNHENNASGISANIGSIFVSNTGCIYESREYFNGYSILNLDFENSKWVVEAREYYYQRDEFSVSSRFAESGLCEFTFKSDPGTNLVVIPSAVITEIQDRASLKLLSFSASDVAPKQIGAMFVEPPIATVDEKQFLSDKNSSDTKYTSLSELARLEESILITGKRESGKTLLLHEIAANRFMEFSPSARLGVVADFSILSKLTEATILEQLVEATGNELRKRDIIDLLDHGRILVCIDNVHIHNSAQLSLIKSFCSKYKNVRYLIGVPEEFYDPMNVSELTPDIGVSIKRVFIHSFRRREVKEMVKRWFGEDSAAANLKLDQINRLLARLNVPTTPFLVSVLLWVIEQRPGSTPVNQAAAIEVLIEGLLDKLKESKSRGNFDSNIQMHFLSDLAVHLDSRACEWMTGLDFDEFVVNYFKRKGLNVSTAGFADELIRKGLIYSGGDLVMFKFDCFRAYFLAKRFAELPALWQKALTIEEVHRYNAEIDLFTGLYRDRRDVLVASLELCKQIFLKSNLDTNLRAIDQFNSIPVFANPANLKSLETDLLTDDYSEARREERLDQIERPSNASVDHATSRKRDQFERSSDELLFVAALRTLSVVVRNSELVDDVNLKQTALSTALEYWSKFLISALKVIQDSDLQEVRIPGLFPPGLSEERLRQGLFLMLPQAIISMMSECLATAKLQVFLQKASLEKDAIIPCLASLMSLESGDQNAAAMVKNVLQRFGDNRFIAQLIFFKVLIIYQLNNLTGSQATGVRSCLVDAFKALRGGPSGQSASEATKFLENIDRSRSLSEMKNRE